MLADILPKIAQEIGASERRDQTWRPRPSGAGVEKCIRAQVYEARGDEKQALPGRAFLVFDDSSWHEELTLDWLRRSVFQVHSQQMKVETPVGPGSIDGIVTDLLGVDRLLEHKAINHFTFERFWGGGVYPEDYFAQCANYIVGLQLVNPAIVEAVLLIKNKNTAQYIEFVLFYDRETDTLHVGEKTRSDGTVVALDYVWEGVIADCKERFAQVAAHVAGDTLPDRPHPFGTDFPCGYCRFERACWAGYLDQFKNAPGEVKTVPEAAGAASLYLTLGQEIRNREEDRAKAKDRLMRVLEDAGAKAVQAGDFKVTVGVQSKSSLDPTLIPDEIKAQATKVSEFPVLRVAFTRKDGVA